MDQKALYKRTASALTRLVADLGIQATSQEIERAAEVGCRDQENYLQAIMGALAELSIAKGRK